MEVGAGTKAGAAKGAGAGVSVSGEARQGATSAVRRTETERSPYRSASK